jgi:flagellar biosynthesis protein FlhG
MAITISIGSGKGGTGKTMIIANLALLLAKSGRRVCLVDLDLGGADAHYLFGLLQPKRSLSDFLNRRVDRLDQVIHPLYAYHGLGLIPGSGDTLHTANISFQEKQRLLRALGQIDTDILLFDIGAGTGYHALDFFMHSDIQIGLTQPEPTAILDFYNFLQLATIRRVLAAFLSGSEAALALKKGRFSTLKEVLDLAGRSDRDGLAKAREALSFFHPLLIINRDGAGGMVNKVKLRQMVARYLAIELPELGDIPEDRSVAEALKAFIPLCELSPNCPAAQALQGIADKLGKIVDLFVHHQQTADRQEISPDGNPRSP